jgi:hypothetical protein
MTKVFDRMTPSLQKIQNNLKDLPQAAFDHWKKVTPKDTGNAKNSTRFVNKDTIWANYKYASKLDQGHSDQLPEGMVDSTKKFLDREVRRRVRK